MKRQPEIRTNNLDDLLIELVIYWLRNDAEALVENGATEEELLDYLNGPMKEKVNLWMGEQRAIIHHTADVAAMKVEIDRCIG